jgi:hypothetical protein
MMRMRHLLSLTLAFLAIQVFGSRATAGPLLDWFCPNDCPPPSYSPARFWAPAAARVHDFCHGPKIPVYPPDRHPEIPPTFTILKYPCPAALPAATIIEPPTPPADSKFKY